MANNCIITKLMGSVNNNNLPVFGEIRFRSISSNPSLSDFSFTPADADASVVGDSVIVKNKYSLTRIVVKSSNYIVDCSEFEYCPLTIFNDLYITDENFIGDLTNLPKTLTTSSLDGTNVVFPVKNLGHLVNLLQFTVSRTSLLNGDIESFVEKQIANGRENCESVLFTTTITCNVTMNSEKIRNFTLSWVKNQNGTYTITETNASSSSKQWTAIYTPSAVSDKWSYTEIPKE